MYVANHKFQYIYLNVKKQWMKIKRKKHTKKGGIYYNILYVIFSQIKTYFADVNNK